MTRRNYKAECIAILAHIKSQKEFDATNWEFDAYAPASTTYVLLIRKYDNGDRYNVLGDKRRTWRELADAMRMFTQGFWHGVKCGLEAETARRIFIQIRTVPNRSGNSRFLYLEFSTEGYRRAVHEELSNDIRISDSFTVTPSEFREYARIAKVCKERK